jgi:hypothetical protein
MTQKTGYEQQQTPKFPTAFGRTLASILGEEKRCEVVQVLPPIEPGMPPAVSMDVTSNW